MNAYWSMGNVGMEGHKMGVYLKEMFKHTSETVQTYIQKNM